MSKNTSSSLCAQHCISLIYALTLVEAVTGSVLLVVGGVVLVAVVPVTLWSPSWGAESG